MSTAIYLFRLAIIKHTDTFSCILDECGRKILLLGGPLLEQEDLES